MRLTIALLIFSLSLLIVTNLHAQPSIINCQNGGSASIGNLKQQVRVSCGPPEHTEIIGYIDKIQKEDRIRVAKVEEWIYSTSFFGEKMFYSLTFEGNKLIEIKKFKKN